MRPSQIGNYLSLLRKRAKLSQGELSKRAGVSRNCISMIEAGNPRGQNVTIGTLGKLFGALGYGVAIKLAKESEE